MVWQQLDLSLFNIVCAATSGFCIVFCVFSEALKERSYISEPIPATLFGFIFNKAGWVVPDNYGSVDGITKDFCRLVLGIQLMLAGVQMPAKYLKKAWISMAMLLVPVMTIMWVVSALVIYLVMPNLSYLEALIIGSCITPTDPVLSGSLVKGSFSDRFVHHGLRDLILAESGANDGFGYPFLYLALFIYRFRGVGIAQHWLLYTVVYEILLSVVYGSVIGFLAQYLVVRAYEKNLADKESYYFSVFALSIFIVGTAGLIGTDDLLACFFAGNTFTWK